MTVNNIGSAILLTAVLWFAYHYGADIYLVGLGLLAAGTWAYTTGTDLAKAHLMARTDYYRAKARYYERLEAEKGDD